MRRSSLPLLAAIPLLILIPPAQGANVQETLMGPKTTRFSMSEDGDHIAIVTPKGSREVVLLDGVEGPVFDEIPRQFLNQTVDPQWSPTGGRSAYIGRRGGDYIAMVDGKEAMTALNPAGMQAMSRTGTLGWKFLFSRDGTRLAYGTATAIDAVVMVTDGVRGAAYRSIDFAQAALNGRRLGYVAQTADQKWHLVLDEKPGPAYDEIKFFTLTRDGAHYAYIARKTGGQVAVIDGVESKLWYMVTDLEQAPDGRVAYMGMPVPQPGNHDNSPHLIVGNLDVAGDMPFGVGQSGILHTALHHVAWSPDGKRFAYVQQNTPNPGVTVKVNGAAMGPTYTSANELQWTSDGAHLGYLAIAADRRNFFVLDGVEGEGYGTISEIQLSPDGKRHAYRTYTVGTGFRIVLDGKVQPVVGNFSVGASRFSPDGKHFGYAQQASALNWQPNVDGVAKPYNLGNFVARQPVNPPITFPQFVWSPDGNHLAFVDQKNDGTGKASVVVDGVSYQGPSAMYAFPSWSPDSRRFAVMVPGPAWGVMVDGKVSGGYDDFLGTSLGGCRFVDGHTFRFYGIKGGQIYRVRVDLGA